jgi:4-amino-4-deoxy-L-arabinose transferase-like glycosyltransferase
MAFIILIAASAVMGTLILHPLTMKGTVETWTFRCCVGLCGAALIALTVGSVSLAWAQYVLATIAVSGMCLQLWLHSRRKEALSASPHETENNTPLSHFDYACLAALAFAGLCTFLSAMAPVTGWDAGVAHIALPSDYAREGRISLHPGNVYSGYPHFMHSLFAVACFSGGDSLEKPVTLLNWYVSLLALSSVYVLGRRLGGRRCGLIAAAILATAPIFVDQAGTVSIDLAFAALATAALAALVVWYQDRDFSWLYLCAILAGSACGVRHTGYLVCAFFGIAVLLGRCTPPDAPSSRWGGLYLWRRLAAALLFGSVALLAASPWLLRSYELLGNPFFPFLLKYFPEAPIDHIAITGFGLHETTQSSEGFQLRKLLTFPLNIILFPNYYDGWMKSPGVMVLLLGVPGLFLGGKSARRLALYSVAGGVFFFYFQQLARYILPFFVPMMVVAALAAARAKKLIRPVLALLLVSFAVGMALHGAAIQFKIPVVLGMENKETYLESRLERYPVFQYANTNLQDGGVVLTIDQRSYYIDRPTYQNHWALKNIASWPLDQQLVWLRKQEIRYILWPVTYVQHSGTLRDALMPMYNEWRHDTEHFKLLKKLSMPIPKKSGMEVVEVYEVLYE